MELKQLRHFVAVVEVGSLSGASEVLHITQPALTRSIKNLEAQLNAELLERQSRGVVPTEAGARLFHQAKMILNETERTARDIGAAARGESGSITIGVAAMFAGEPTATILARLSDTLPDLRVHVVEGFFEDLMTDLKNARVEAVLSNFPPGIVDDAVVFEPLTKVTSRFVASANHKLASKSSVTMNDLSDCKLAMVGQPHVSLLVADLFAAEEVGLTPPVIETNSLSLLRAMMIAHDFVSLLPDHLLTGDIEQGTVVQLPIPGTPFERASGLILRRSDSQRPAVVRFLDIARDVLKTWPDRPGG